MGGQQLWAYLTGEAKMSAMSDSLHTNHVSPQC
jgi:hypothetical protein